MSVLATIDRYVYLNTNIFYGDTVDVVHKGVYYIVLGSVTFIKTLTDGKSYSFMAPLMIMTVCITTILQACMQKLH